ncbi:MAG TPA: glycosyltransferase family 2 protein [Luteimonas sp.]|nr:glycosyltransferase family 2 protein [Luteimonas sp.]
MIEQTSATSPQPQQASPPRGRAGGVRAAPVSVVVPCFRCAATIGEAVASIAAQTLRPAEVLLVDDCSGDDTVDALHRLAAMHEPGWIRVVALPANGGPSRARNAGWQEATQPYIAFLDADDSWVERKLEIQMAALAEDPGISLIAHPMVVRERGVAAPAVRPPVRTTVVGRRRLLLHNPFPTASVVLRRDLPFRFDENFRRVEDFLLWAQIAFSGHRCARVNQVLAVWHKENYGAGGLSDDLPAMHRAGRQVRRELVRQGLINRWEDCIARAFGVVRRSRRNLLMWVRRRGPYRSPQRTA